MTEPRMTDEQRAMAVEIMKDVIARLDAKDGKVVFESGHYLVVSDDADAQVPFDAADLRDLLPAIESAGCQVCMLGGVMLSKAKLYDNVPLGTLDLCPLDDLAYASVDRGDTIQALEDVFDELTLDMLESAFEQGRFSDGGNYFHPLVCGAAIYGYRLRASGIDQPGIARAIAQNVIDNGGVFVVEPVSDRDYHEVRDSILTAAGA